MHTFQINVLIKIFSSSPCFEHLMFIVSKTILYMHFVWYVFQAEITIRGYIQYIKYKAFSYYNGTKIAQSVERRAMGWTGRGAKRGGGEIVRTHPDGPRGPPSLLYTGYGVFPGGKAAGAWRSPPTSSSAVIECRVELYICSPSGPSWPVLRWPLPLPYISS
jgi:hypothetical protein